MRVPFKAFVSGFTALALLLAPAVASISEAEAADPPARKTVVKMGLGERIANIGGGVGLVTGGVLATGYVGGTTILGALYAGAAAIGITGAVAVAVVPAVIIGAIGLGTYFIVKGIVGKKRVDVPPPTAPSGVNVSRDDRTNPSSSPGRPGRVGVGGASGAGMPR